MLHCIECTSTPHPSSIEVINSKAGNDGLAMVSSIKPKAMRPLLHSAGLQDATASVMRTARTKIFGETAEDYEKKLTKLPEFCKQYEI